MTEINPVEAILDREFPTPEARRACPVTVVCMADAWQVYGASTIEDTADAMIATTMTLVSIIADTAKTPADALSMAHTFSEKIMQGVMSLAYGNSADDLRADVELLNARTQLRGGVDE